MVLFTWKENFGGKSAAAIEPSPPPAAESAGVVVESAAEDESSGSDGRQDGGTLVKEALGVMMKDKKILLVGAVQALFESAMYIFVLQWPPALKAALGAGVTPPFGKIFSCFMVRATAPHRGAAVRAWARQGVSQSVRAWAPSPAVLGRAWCYPWHARASPPHTSPPPRHAGLLHNLTYLT